MSKVVGINNKPYLGIRKSTNPKAKDCNHIHVELVEDERLVECQDCGNNIDPFEFLLYHAQNETNLWENLSNLHKEYNKRVEEYNKKLKQL